MLESKDMQLAPCSPSSSSTCSMTRRYDEQSLVSSNSSIARAVVRTRDEAKEEVQVMRRQSFFALGCEHHLAVLLRDLEEQEQKLLQKQAPPLRCLAGSTHARHEQTAEPSTPPLRHLIALDPLAHLASPLSPLQLDDEDSGDCSQTEDYGLAFQPDHEVTQRTSKRARLHE